MRLFRYWNRYVALGGILLSAIFCGMAIFLVSILPLSGEQARIDVQMTVIPAQTFTPTPEHASETGVAPTGENQAINGIQAGTYVQITGTNGSGLRIRSNPGLNADVNFLGMDNEVFLVKDGPIDSDGYIWWYIESPYDANRSGWSASDFLSIIEQ